jgi:imidazole glycerol-phosphate synthase subunit HisH
MIAIVDYGIGNLNSIRNMLNKIDVECTITSSPEEIRQARKLIMPGIGAFDAGMSRLIDSGLIPTLNETVMGDKTPVLGICLGMQLMTRGSEEGSLPGLGWIAATTRRFDRAIDPTLKVPHMGWNVARPVKESALLHECPAEPRFYFTHSFYVACENPQDQLLTVRHGSTVFDAGFEHGNLMGVQFHPEKSHRFGMWFFKNFAGSC